MIYLHADHIITPLGEGAEANLQGIRLGQTRLQRHSSVHGEELVTPVMASLLDEEVYRMEGYTLLEALCIRCIAEALSRCSISPADDRCVFVLSSTKGDIWTPMSETARHIAGYFGNGVSPVVVSTACTSGVSAQLAAQRLIESGRYDSAVVVGCDVQREFIVSGFQCFHALSERPCRPFDKERDGLNAGEAVACMVLSNRPGRQGWTLLGGSIHNDANHISGPSRTAEGSLRCLQDALALTDREQLGLVSVHGTGTLYNDEMESIALHRAGLGNVPVTALKGVYGHTMGAAGLLETILSIHALNEGEILPSPGYREQGTTYPVSLSGQTRKTDKRQLVKLLSGFGGVNAAVAWGAGGEPPRASGAGESPVTGGEPPRAGKPEIPECPEKPGGEPPRANILAEVRIEAPADLAVIYRQEIGGYPKFFKMDQLSRLAFVAVELLLKQVRTKLPDFALDSEHCALILANRSASLKNDTDYQATIADKRNYYPSPALFVYTLPNIMTGEIAIRHGLYGETACYILDSEEEMAPIVEASLRQPGITQAIVGWVECKSAEEYVADVKLEICN